MEIEYKGDKFYVKFYRENVVITDPENDFIVIPKKVIQAINVML